MTFGLAEQLEVAADLAREAGRALLPWCGRERAKQKDGSPVTAADRLANRLIVSSLASRYPGDGILSEESRDTAVRRTRARVWVIDPLDGTREFIDGIGEFAVMIGLAVNGRAVLGVVYCPFDDTLYGATDGCGAWVERGGGRQRLEARPAPGPQLRMVGSRSHPDPRLLQIQEALRIEDVQPSGSVGVKCARIALGERDLYVHPVPYLKEWDTCAPEVILREAGGTVCDCAGEPLRYNKAEPIQPRGILAAAPGVLPLVLAAVRTAFNPDAASSAAAT